MSIDKKSKNLNINVSLLFNKLEPASGSRGGGIRGCMSRGGTGVPPPFHYVPDFLSKVSSSGLLQFSFQ